MTKADLIKQIGKEAGITKKAAGSALNAFIAAIHDSLKKEDGNIRVAELGTFLVVHKKARTGVNPRTKKKIHIGASKVPRFRAAKSLRQAVKKAKRYSFIVKDRYTEESVFAGEVEAQDDHEAYEMAKSQISDKDMLASLRKGGLVLAIQYGQ